MKKAYRPTSCRSLCWKFPRRHLAYRFSSAQRAFKRDSVAREELEAGCQRWNFCDDPVGFECSDQRNAVMAQISNLIASGSSGDHFRERVVLARSSALAPRRAALLRRVRHPRRFVRVVGPTGEFGDFLAWLKLVTGCAEPLCRILFLRATSPDRPDLRSVGERQDNEVTGFPHHTIGSAKEMRHRTNLSTTG
jgi:hypothetical protein